MGKYYTEEEKRAAQRNTDPKNMIDFETGERLRRSTAEGRAEEERMNNFFFQQDIMQLEEGIYQAYLSKYHTFTAKSGNPCLALELSVHDLISDCWKRHTAYITPNGVPIIAENLQRQFRQKFSKFQELLEYMKENDFWVELRESDDGSGFMQTMFLRSEAQTVSLDAFQM